jgi:c(7)-type cytochrome triheme protein
MVDRERSVRSWLISRISRLGWILISLLLAGAAWAVTWLPLAKDGIHDPAGPAIGVLQEPREALSVLPPDTVGNQVSWVQALEKGHIKPRAYVRVPVDSPTRDTDVILRNTGEMPMVKFPHRQHTAWLDCGSCHDEIFGREAGKTKINMSMILRGEKCGLCHGAVSFPLTECVRCHSVVREIGPRLADGRN